MIVTEKQLLVLLQTTMDSLAVVDTIYSPFRYKCDVRRKVMDEVVNQQTAVLTAEAEPLKAEGRS